MPCGCPRVIERGREHGAEANSPGTTKKAFSSVQTAYSFTVSKAIISTPRHIYHFPDLRFFFFFFEQNFKTKSSICSFFQSLKSTRGILYAHDYDFPTHSSPVLFCLLSSPHLLFSFSFPLLCSLVFLTCALTCLEEEGGEEGKKRERRGKVW